MAISFVDQVWEDGRENFGGALGALYFMPRSAADISALTCTDGMTITGNITPVASEKAIKVYATDDSILYGEAQEGDPNGEKTMNTLAFFHPGDSKTSGAFKRKVSVTPGIWFFKDSLGNFRVLGLTILQNQDLNTYTITTDVEARIRTREGTHGNRADSRKGTTYTINHVAPHEAPFYDGVIPHDDFPTTP